MAKPGIVIKTYNRPDLLEKCLISIFKCYGIEWAKIVVVRQKGNNEVERVLEKYKERFASYLETDAIGDSVDAYITNNMMLGYQIAFEFWKADYVISIEEDVVVSRDAIHFVDSIFKQFANKPRFRGVNLGSRLPYSSDNLSTYSLLRFGIHGPAGMITCKTWKRIKVKRVLSNDSIIFDAQLEFELKSGFMVTPNCSRFEDFGVSSARTGETHFNQRTSDYDEVSNYFAELRESFVGLNALPSNYYRDDIEPQWRRDCQLYDSRLNFIYDLKAKFYPLLNTKLGRRYLRLRLAWNHKRRPRIKSDSN